MSSSEAIPASALDYIDCDGFDIELGLDLHKFPDADKVSNFDQSRRSTENSKSVPLLEPKPADKHENISDFKIVAMIRPSDACESESVETLPISN